MPSEMFPQSEKASKSVLDALSDDLNTPKAIARLHRTVDCGAEADRRG